MSALLRTPLVVLTSLVCWPACAASVQIDLIGQGLFNADPVYRYVNSQFAGGKNAWDTYGWRMGTQSAVMAAALQFGGDASNTVGLRDDGFYAAGTQRRHYDVQFAMTNFTAAGTLTAFQPAVGSHTWIDVPDAHYAQLALFGSSGTGSTTFDLTLFYASGTPYTVKGVLPDWYADPNSDAGGISGTFFSLSGNQSRIHGTSSGPDQYEKPYVSTAQIFGLNLAPDQDRLLLGVLMTRTDQSGAVANFLAAAGDADVPEPSTYGLTAAAIGLLLTIKSVRRNSLFTARLPARRARPAGPETMHKYRASRRTI